MKLMKLIKQNPELEVIPRIKGEHEQGYISEFGNAYIDKVLYRGNKVYFYKDDYDKLVEEVVERDYWLHYEKVLSKDKFREMAEKMVDLEDWEDVIVLDIVEDGEGVPMEVETYKCNWCGGTINPEDDLFEVGWAGKYHTHCYQKATSESYHLG